MSKVSVLVGDSQRLFAESLAGVLRQYSGIVVLDCYPSTAAEAIKVIEDQAPQVALLDQWMPDMNGPAMTAMVMSRAPKSKVMLLSWFHAASDVSEAIEAGAVGFLPKSLTVDAVVGAVRRANAGEAPVYPEELGKMLETMRERVHIAGQLRERLKTLTRREWELLGLLSFGKSIPDIAKEAAIRPHTVQLHFSNIVRKSGAKTKEEALAWARYCGFLKT